MLVIERMIAVNTLVIAEALYLFNSRLMAVSSPWRAGIAALRPVWATWWGKRRRRAPRSAH
jgi:hypothetical protein